MPLEPGTKLAHYQLVERIGQGGMGVVWRARDPSLDREVAIKVLTDDFAAEPRQLARFEREARLLAAISHPNVATVYGLHEQDGTRFLAMELIEGEDLSARLRRGALPVPQALAIARQVAAALEATHRRGVIHRDLKPANIYLTHEGEVKVLDFGVARDLFPGRDSEPEDDAAEKTRAGTILGTVSFMSPEQARGKPVDAGTDLWAFGCVLYQMLAGKPAFGGETRWDKLAAVLREEPDWSALPASLPEPIRGLLRRCLDKDQDRRLAQATEARRIVERALGMSTDSSEISEATETSIIVPVSRLRRWAAVALLLALAVVVWGLWPRSQPPAPPGPETAAGEPASDRHSLAVLPFTSLGEGDPNGAFTAGIHNDILNRIAKISDLKVISQTSVREYVGTSKNLRQIGQELGVATLLEGSVQRAGDQVRVSVQLVDAASDQNLWAASYDRELSAAEIFSVQAEIAEQIAVALQATLTADEQRRIGALPTASMEAYEAYLHGLESLSRPGQRRDNLDRAALMFKEAVALDDGFALAHAGLAQALRGSYWFQGAGPEALEEGFAAARRALELEPDLPEAHLALGTLHYIRRDYDAALAELELAEQGLPGSADLLVWKAAIVRRRGRWAEALRTFERAGDLDPRRAETVHEIGMTLLCMRRYDESIKAFDRALALGGDLPHSHIFRALAPVLRDGTPEAARQAAVDITAVEPTPWKYSHGWQVLLCAGDLPGAAALVSEVDRIDGQWQEYPSRLLLGLTHLMQGDREMAARELEAAVVELESDLEARPEDARLHGAMGLALAGLGRKDEALAAGRRAVEMMPLSRDSFVGAWLLQDLAWIEVMAGEEDAAVASLGQVLSRPAAWSAPWLRLDPRFAPLRQRADFKAMLDAPAG